jgi:adenylylsulfate reductase subunit A
MLPLGRWQCMINGESCKVIVAEAAKNALGMDNIYDASSSSSC